MVLIQIIVLALFVAPIVSLDVGVYSISNINEVWKKGERWYWALINGFYHALFLFLGMGLFKFVAEWVSALFELLEPALRWLKVNIPQLDFLFDFLIDIFDIATPTNILSLFAIFGFVFLYRMKFRELAEDGSINADVEEKKFGIVYRIVRFIFMGRARKNKNLSIVDRLFERSHVVQNVFTDKTHYLKFIQKYAIAPAAVALDMWYLTPLLKSVLGDMSFQYQFIFVLFVFAGVAGITYLICATTESYINKVKLEITNNEKSSTQQVVFSLGLILWVMTLLEPIGSGYFAFDLFMKTWGALVDEGLSNVFINLGLGSDAVFSSIINGDVKIDTTLTSIILSVIFTWYLVSRYNFSNISRALRAQIQINTINSTGNSDE